jgi:hypothetical protein
MTRQESFKRRVRARMAKTGERYGAARRALIARSSGAGRTWVTAPKPDDKALREATGRGWDEWCDIVDAWPGNSGGHTAIAAHLEGELGVPHWWAQTVTLGYERITGRRVPHQQPDGTFTTSTSRTIVVDTAAVREMLLDDTERDSLFPGYGTVLRSRPTAKTLRVAIGPGVAQFSFDPRANGRTNVTVTHERLHSPDDVAEWKSYWAEWLEALHDPDDSLTSAGDASEGGQR